MYMHSTHLHLDDKVAALVFYGTLDRLDGTFQTFHGRILPAPNINLISARDGKNKPYQ